MTSALELLRKSESKGMIKIEIPKGDISEEGINLVNYKIYDKFNQYLPDDWEWKWLVTKGDYAGTFPKRVGSWLKREFGIKADTRFLSEIGNIARANSETRSQYIVDFVSEFNWDAGDFGDSGSCFWSCNEEAKSMLYGANGFAIRFYESSETTKFIDHKGTCGCEQCQAKVQETIKNGNPELDDDDLMGFGRCWIMPDFPNDGDMTIFNAYPTNFKLIRVARIMATYFGLSYVQLSSLRNQGVDDGTLWINNGAGYVITSSERVEDYRDEDLDFRIVDPDKKQCYHCDEWHDEDEMNWVQDDLYCNDCYSDHTFYCERCEERYNNDNETSHSVYHRSYWGRTEQQTWCENCANEYATTCDNCNDLTSHTMMNECEECGSNICSYCMDSHYHEEEEMEEENV